MKRRDFSLACGVGVASSLLMTGGSAQAQGQKFEAGKDYTALDRAAPVDAPKGKIEVVEFFSYNCPHCNHFVPAFEAWRKKVPTDVAVRFAPVAFMPGFAVKQRLFFALEGLGLVDKLHAKVFAAIHADRLPLDTVEQVTDWVVKQGVDKTKFLAQYNSFSTNTKVSKATQLQDSYGVNGVPMLGVAGRFWVDGELAKNMDRALQIVDYLTSVVRSGR